MLLAIVLFLLTYVGLLVFPKYRAYIAIGSALIFVLVGIMPLDEIFGSVDWNVILMIAGTMGIVAFVHRIENAGANSPTRSFRQSPQRQMGDRRVVALREL
ncbi:MAG: hypothetical protein MZU97_04700 [Bacillus subtilis]|nr:hypothetical protein [Bacillus subtilis]